VLSCHRLDLGWTSEPLEEEVLGQSLNYAPSHCFVTFELVQSWISLTFGSCEEALRSGLSYAGEASDPL